MWMWASTAVIACTAILLAACATGGEEPAVALSEVDRDRSDLCFDAKTLPKGFVLTTRNPDYFAGTLTDREYDELGRTGSRVHRYVFEAPSTPAEDADGFLSIGERESAYAQVEREDEAMPFTASTCRVDIYNTVEGAKQAVEAERRAMQTAPPEGAVTTELAVEERYTTVLYEQSPSDTEIAVTFRASNLLGRITLTGSCDEGKGCSHLPQMAESLAGALFRRVNTRLDLQSDPPLRSEDRVRARAEDDCPEQDHLGCIAEYLRRVKGSKQVGLCRTLLGDWFFEAPTGKAGEPCADGESEIVALIGG